MEFKVIQEGLKYIVMYQLTLEDQRVLKTDSQFWGKSTEDANEIGSLITQCRIGLAKMKVKMSNERLE